MKLEAGESSQAAVVPAAVAAVYTEDSFFILKRKEEISVLEQNIYKFTQRITISLCFHNLHIYPSTKHLSLNNIHIYERNAALTSLTYIGLETQYRICNIAQCVNRLQEICTEELHLPKATRSSIKWHSPSARTLFTEKHGQHARWCAKNL